MEIAIIGAGTMGNGIAHVFALKGHRVTLIDQTDSVLTNAIQQIDKNLQRQVQKEIISSDQKSETLNHLSVKTSFENEVGEKDLVIEAVNEDINLKMEIFEKLNKNIIPKTQQIISQLIYDIFKKKS